MPLILKLFSHPVIRNTGTEDTLNPPLQERGRAAPPVGVNNNEKISFLNLRAERLNPGIKTCAPGDFRTGKKRINRLSVEIVNGRCACRERGGLCILRKRVTEAVLKRVAQHNCRLHDLEYSAAGSRV